jgi:hypothetical protein
MPPQLLSVESSRALAKETVGNHNSSSGIAAIVGRTFSGASLAGGFNWASRWAMTRRAGVATMRSAVSRTGVT